MESNRGTIDYLHISIVPSSISQQNHAPSIYDKSCIVEISNTNPSTKNQTPSPQKIKISQSRHPNNNLTPSRKCGTIFTYCIFYMGKEKLP